MTKKYIAPNEIETNNLDIQLIKARRYIYDGLFHTFLEALTFI
jgi:hypothetical protein